MTKYIDANSFLEYEENRCKNSPPLIGTCSFDNATLREELANFLEANVAPVVHGRWITHYRSGTPVAEGYVSTCCDRWNNRKSDYCPNCGAKMDKEANDE